MRLPVRQQTATKRDPASHMSAPPSSDGGPQQVRNALFGNRVSFLKRENATFSSGLPSVSSPGSHGISASIHAESFDQQSEATRSFVVPAPTGELNVTPVRRMSGWTKVKDRRPSEAKPEQNPTTKSILDNFMSTAKRLADEVREERLEEMVEANALRSCSMSNVVSSNHPARCYSRHFGGGHGSLRVNQVVERRPLTAVKLLRKTSKEHHSSTISASAMPTFSLQDKMFFLFSGVPNALRKSDELEAWLRPSSLISTFTLIIVTVSCISFCVESLPAFYNSDPTPAGIQTLSFLCMAWLTLELGMRMIFCRDIIELFKMPMTWVDVASNVPYYIELASGQRVARILILIRLLRLTRILRVFDLSKHNVGMQSVYGALVKSASALSLFLLLLTLILFIGSSLIYIAEMTEEDFDNASDTLYYVSTGKPSPFSSILETLWFVITTITTVGYGEVVVVTPAGRLVASLLMLVGPFVIAFPTVILSSNFQETHRELIEAIEQTNSSAVAEVSADESKRKNEIKSAEFAAVMRQFVPKSMHDEMSKRDELLHQYANRTDLTYTLSVGAPPRAIVIKDGVALYNPLLMVRCAYEDGEPEYGFQSNTGVLLSVRDNFPRGSVVRFKILLHTAFTQEAAIMAVHQYMKSHPGVSVSTVAPRPIRLLRVSMKSKHALLSHMQLVCTKFHDPFGTIPLEVVLGKPEALPVLLRYSSSCSFHFKCEFHDATVTDVEANLSQVLASALVEYNEQDKSIGRLLRKSFGDDSCDETLLTSEGNDDESSLADSAF